MKKILLVDGQKTILHVLDFALASSRIQTVFASSEREAFQRTSQHHFDLILLDGDLQGGEGLEVLRQLKLDEKTQDIPVVFLTGRDQLEDKIQALSLGAVDYLSKPFSLEDIHQCIDRILYPARNIRNQMA